tara:strand:+ start:125 stop:247 length:123 start_codon:yes stop_codon:yes gene_type:complete
MQHARKAQLAKTTSGRLDRSVRITAVWANAAPINVALAAI